MSDEDAERFVAELEALVEGRSDESPRARPSASEVQADLERMEVLWRMVENPKGPTEPSS